MIEIVNACRSSNLSNLTILDVHNAQDDENLKGRGKVIDQRRYKTSFVYGTKSLLIPIDIFNHIKVYLKVFRPLLIQDREICGENALMITIGKLNV